MCDATGNKGQVLLVSRNYGMQSGLEEAVKSQGFQTVFTYGMRSADSYCVVNNGDDRTISAGEFVAAIVDDEVMSGLGVNEIIIALTALGIPCVALTSTGHDSLGSAAAGARQVIYSRAVVDALFDQRIKLSALK